MSIETEKSNEALRRRSLEAQEVGYESKEGEVDEEVKKAAALERADYLVKEVKSSKQQIQNIVLHMQQVVNSIRQLRAQLQLADNVDDPSSVAQDKKKVEELKSKIGEYSNELEKMKGDLIREQVEELKQDNVEMTPDQLQTKAEDMVNKMIADIKE